MMNTDKLSQNKDLQIDDVVKVREGFYDSEFDVDMSSWHGRVIELFPEQGTALIAFDSLTLKDMPQAYFEQCAEEGYDWNKYGYDLHDLIKTEARDTQSDVQAALSELENQYLYSYLGEEGREINRIFQTTDPDQTANPIDVWAAYLKQNLNFPFEAEIDEWQERGPLRAGDKMRVSGIHFVDENYGLIVEADRGRSKVHFPLCDLAAVDKNSLEHELIDLYRTWFANR